MTFVQARWYTRTDGRQIDLIVLHSMEAPEKGDTAEAVAAYFARGTVKASAHYCIDANSIVQSVFDRDIAWAAPGANRDGLQMEHAGYARQTPEEWADPYSETMLRRSAALVARKCRRYNVPARIVYPAGLLVGRRGITTHAFVSQAFHRSDHTDPGPNFPLRHYLELVRGYLAS